MMTSLPQQFRIYLQQLGYSEGTCRMLPACIREFLQYGCFTALVFITPAHIQDFYQWLHVRPLKHREGALSEVMISHYVYGLKVFFNWLEVTGRLRHNPISGLRFRRPVLAGRHPLTVSQVKELFTVAVSCKEQATVHLFYSCGLRRSEAAALRLSDVHIKQRLLYVRAGKGAKRRVVPLTAHVAGSLAAYVQNERKTPRQETGAFMLNRIGAAMSGDSYNRLLKQLVQRARLPAHITPHYLRHSIATHLLQGGMSLEYVRDFLGHQHLEATQLYAKVSEQQLQQL